MPRVVSPLLWGGLLLVTACARDLARASSGAIGCPHENIAVSEVSVGWSRMSWTARCREQTFYCSGEDAPTCAPELEISEPAPRSEPPHRAPAKLEAPPEDPPPAEPAPSTDPQERGEQETTTDDPA
jgi:hypothetical protein